MAPSGGSPGHEDNGWRVIAQSHLQLLFEHKNQDVFKAFEADLAFTAPNGRGDKRINTALVVTMSTTMYATGVAKDLVNLFTRVVAQQAVDRRKPNIAAFVGSHIHCPWKSS